MALTRDIGPNGARLGILFMLAGTFSISLNDMMVKALSGDYPLHQIVFARSTIGLGVGLLFVMAEGGLHLLRQTQIGLQTLRALLIVTANMSFFAALAALPLADATALFFVAPIFITVLSVPLLGERIGPVRVAAVLVGFLGVVVMQRPWADSAALEVSRLVLILPVIAALTYALAAILTRALGRQTRASVLSCNIQFAFVLISIGFFIVAGDGRFAAEAENPSVIFLLRAWVFPQVGDLWVFVGLGVNSAILGYCLSEAYRRASAATVAPYEYAALPLAVAWGALVFGDLPAWDVWLGMALVMASGVVVFVRMRDAGAR